MIPWAFLFYHRYQLSNPLSIFDALGMLPFAAVAAAKEAESLSPCFSAMRKSHSPR
jgi:hypothetical protein